MLVIVGDFDTSKTIGAVKEIFGKIPKNKNIDSIDSKAEFTNKHSSDNYSEISDASQPIILKQPGSAPIFQAIYPLPTAKHKDVEETKENDMMKKLLACVAVCSLVAGMAQSEVFRYRLSGNWATVTDGTTEGWGLNPNNDGFNEAGSIEPP